MSSIRLPPGSCDPDLVVDISRPLTRVTKDVNRGRQITLDPPDGCVCEGDDVEVFDTLGSCNIGELLCVTLGISLATCEPEDFLVDGFVYPSVRASVRWGLGGAPFAAECDWLHGTQLSIVAETISVSAKYLRNTAPGDECEECCGPSFRLAAGVGYGNVGRNSNPARLTELVQIVTPGSKRKIRIPAFAISFNVVLVGPAPRTAEANVFGFGQGYSVPYTFVAPPSGSTTENAHPLFNGAQFIEITNTNGAGPLFAYVIFGLAL